jgi:SAM-dependent methyltransferase
MSSDINAEVASVVERWRQSIMAGDVAAAAALRDDGYRFRGPGGQLISRARELESVASAQYRVDAFGVENLRVEHKGSKATVVFDCFMEGSFAGAEETLAYLSTIDLIKREGGWKAREWRLEEHPLHPRRRRTFRESLDRLLGRRSRKGGSSFQDLAYIPYRAGEDFALPKSAEPSYDPGVRLPLPPPGLWLGYNYPRHGRMHVERMLEIVQAPEFAFRPGDRILDFGCGAGRMIRHLEPLAATCEIWGTDISATHITWCKRNLSPPFRFATTTKVPHLPFEDRSFRFIYCGSVFTHIDDLADAWLLELRRILEPKGRLYVTIHDNHTLSLLENGSGGEAGWRDRVLNAKVYRESKGAFDMFTVGRDDQSQVFYDQAYFLRMAGNMFDVLSVTPEAYFYQTAVLLERR